jgi:hypothetical protein
MYLINSPLGVFVADSYGLAVAVAVLFNGYVVKKG